MIKSFISKSILKRFFSISLSRFELQIAQESVEKKYAPAVTQSILFSILLIPALLTLNTQVVISVLIPTTMVAGTAWFSVSLASMKKKFEDFGLELTTNLFVAFTLSLQMLLLATAASLTETIWSPYIPEWAASPWAVLIFAIIALVVVGKLLFAIFAGSLKYDINDAMLTGQNEAAERYFKQSLSVLHVSANSLRSHHSLQVANYTIGVAFYEVFSVVEGLQIPNVTEKAKALIEEANVLIKNPSVSQEEADNIALDLAKKFMGLCNDHVDTIREHKSFEAIQDEIACMENNDSEDQAMKDTRMSVVFAEMASLIDEFGEELFNPQLQKSSRQG